MHKNKCTSGKEFHHKYICVEHLSNDTTCTIHEPPAFVTVSSKANSNTISSNEAYEDMDNS